MAVFKCKMCGGALEINDNQTVATCEYCGTTQTLPKLDDDKRANMYDRANHFRRNNEYDKAMGIYEQILNEDNTDAEAYWSLVLCKYGIEYVEDPTTHKRIPTVNRTQYTSVFDDDNYKSALQYADGYQKQVYQEEAKAINEIQKNILAISQNEEPFDVFICYKETDNAGRRTPDSVLANDLYYQLTQEGFKVFFARITLEDKLGTAYEPYIFAALNSAKAMVVLGTKPEYFNAVWVRNEWSRYLSLIKQGQKKVLIPAYKDMDPYDLPDEFSHLQAQDMSKLGFMQDLIRGIKKIVQTDTPTATVVKETVVSGQTNIAPLLKRAFMFLEDGNWASADEYCEKVLDIDPENAQAYLGKLMATTQVRKKELLATLANPFNNLLYYDKVMRFGDEALKEELNGYIAAINERNEKNRITGIYSRACASMNTASTSDDYTAAAALFDQIPEYKDAQTLASTCREKAKAAEEEETLKHRNEILNQAKQLIETETAVNYRKAINILNTISDYAEATQLIQDCKQDLKRLECDEYNYVKKVAAKNKISSIVLNIITTAICISVFIIIFSDIIHATLFLVPLVLIEIGLQCLSLLLTAQLYKLIGNDYELIYCPKTRSKKIEILSTYNKKDVTSIANYAFFNCKKLDTLILPNTISTIGEKAFINCKELTTIIINCSMQRWEQIAKYVVFESNKVVIQCNDGRIPYNVIAKWQAEIRNETR